MYDEELPDGWRPDPAFKFGMRDRVRKIRGSHWQGKVVGFYHTDATPRGYSVESELEIGSVQVWPEAALEMVMSNTVDFGTAVRALKTGRRVSRSGWNGKNMWLALVSDWQGTFDNQHWDWPLHSDTPFKESNMLPFIAMFTADRKFVPWLASQTDVLAEDWTVLDA